MTAIHDKIRKLLAVAQGQANEAESNSALAMATALMAKHGIDQSQLRNEPTGPIRGAWFNLDGKYLRLLAQATGRLYGTVPLFDPDRGTAYFVGRPENIDASQDTLAFLIVQLESFYKAALPTGLTQSDRAQFRKAFKLSCAIRVYHRCVEIVEGLSQRDNKAAGTRALMVLDHFKQLKVENDELLKGVKTRAARSITIRSSLGAAEGSRAGNLMEINRSVE